MSTATKYKPNFVRSAAEFNNLIFTISPYRSVLSQTQARKLLEQSSDAITIYEMAEMAANGGCVLNDGRTIYATTK